MWCKAMVLVLALGVGMLGSVAVGAEGKKASEFWQADRAHTIHIRLTQQQWFKVQPTRKQSLPRLDASAMVKPKAEASTKPVVAAQTKPAQQGEAERLSPNFYGYEFAYTKAGFECDGVEVEGGWVSAAGELVVQRDGVGVQAAVQGGFQSICGGAEVPGVDELLLE